MCGVHGKHQQENRNADPEGSGARACPLQQETISHSKRSFLMLPGLDKDRTTDQVHQATMHPALPCMSKAASAPTSHKAISQPSSDGSVHPGLGTSRKLHKGADPHVIHWHPSLSMHLWLQGACYDHPIGEVFKWAIPGYCYEVTVASSCITAPLGSHLQKPW